jgi:hypothetical protein
MALLVDVLTDFWWGEAGGVVLGDAKLRHAGGCAAR